MNSKNNKWQLLDRQTERQSDRRLKQSLKLHAHLHEVHMMTSLIHTCGPVLLAMDGLQTTADHKVYSMIGTGMLMKLTSGEM